MRVMAILGVVALSLAAPASADTADRVITVTGQGSVETAPDMATITMGVTNQAKEAKAALAVTSAGVAAILLRLKEMGVDDRDMQTSGLSLSPVWSNRSYESGKRPEISGFSASNQVSVRVRALSDLGQILDAVVSDGANDFNGLRFGVQEPGPLQDEARRRAVKDAMAKAALLADAAGVTLGPVQSMSEHGGRAQPQQMMEMAATRSGDVPIAAGEVGLSASVSMVFSITDD